MPIAGGISELCCRGSPKGPATSKLVLRRGHSYGLGTYTSIGKLMDIRTPMANALIEIASGLLNRDFIAEDKKTLERLGFKNVTPSSYSNDK